VGDEVGMEFEMRDVGKEGKGGGKRREREEKKREGGHSKRQRRSGKTRQRAEN